MEATARLAEEGLAVAVGEMATIKPLDPILASRLHPFPWCLRGLGSAVGAPDGMRCQRRV